MLVIAEQVGRQHAAGQQGAQAIRIEARAAEGGRQARFVVAVEQQHVGAARMLADVADGIRLDDAQARVVGRQHELLAQGNHVGAQFQHRDARVGQVAVAEFQQRTAAQSHHQDVPRARHEQGKAHHGARIAQQQIVGARQQHFALDHAGLEFQAAPVATGMHLRGKWGGASVFRHWTTSLSRLGEMLCCIQRNLISSREHTRLIRAEHAYMYGARRHGRAVGHHGDKHVFGSPHHYGDEQFYGA
ncbi:hypothetical protein D3C72_1531790 [compost metagenome]